MVNAMAYSFVLSMVYMLFVVSVSKVDAFSSAISCRNGCGNGKCVARKCQCDPGFEGGSCERAISCGNGCDHGKCIAGKCECDPGFEGGSCESDSNECSRRPCQHRCMNTRGSYRCYCDEGFMLSNNEKDCYPDPIITCSKGWRVDENGKCIDNDECALNPNTCPAGKQCLNTIGSYTCLCPSGESYQWINDDLVCADEDECAVRIHNCHDNAICVNKVNGFTCVCKSGFVGDGEKHCKKLQEPPIPYHNTPFFTKNEPTKETPTVTTTSIALIPTTTMEPIIPTTTMEPIIPTTAMEPIITTPPTTTPPTTTPPTTTPPTTTPPTTTQTTTPTTTTPPTTTPTTAPTTTPTTSPPTTTPTTMPPTTTPTTAPTTTPTTTPPTTPTTAAPTTTPTTAPTTTPTTTPPTTTPPTTTPTTAPTTTPTTSPPTTTPTTMPPTTTPTTAPTTTPTTTPPTTTPTTAAPSTTPTTAPTTTPTTSPPTTTPTTMPPTTTPTTAPPTTTPTTPTTTPTTTPPTTPPTTTPTTAPTTTPTTTPMTTTIPTTTPTTTPPTTTPTTLPTTTATTTVPTTTPTTAPTTQPTTTVPTTTPTTTQPTTTMPTTTPTTLPPTTTIPTTTPTTSPPTTTIPTTTEPPTTTPPPPGVRIVTTDRLTKHDLPGVDIRVLVPDSNITRVYTEDRTGDSGSTLLDLPEDDPVIITFSRHGYLNTSMTYKFERVGRNVITMPMNKAPEIRKFVWHSGFGKTFEFRKNTINPFTVTVQPGALDVAEGKEMTLEFKQVDVSNAQDLREAPELIGAHFPNSKDDDYVFEGLETFGMVIITIDKKSDPSHIKLFLPLTIEIPLRNVPQDVKIGDKLEVWFYDPYRGVWLFDRKGEVDRGFGSEKIFRFETGHLSWLAVVRRIDTTNCVTVWTCYDTNCLYPAPNLPIRLRGTDFFYSTVRTSNENGRACFHYKHLGEVEISSQCATKKKKKRGKGKSSVCPAKFNSQLITSEAKKAGNNCGNVKLKVSKSICTSL